MSNTFEPLRKVLFNIAIMIGLYAFTRIAFILGNLSAFPGISMWNSVKLCLIGVRYDLAAIAVLSLPYAVMALFPCRARAKKGYRKILKWVFIIPNFIGAGLNVYDITYFEFDNRRTTASIFKEFSHDTNAGKIFAEALIDFWYLYLIGGLILYIMIKFYRKQKHTPEQTPDYVKRHATILACFLVPYSLFLADAFKTTEESDNFTNRFIDTPLDAAIIKNTPAAIMETLSGVEFSKPEYFTDRTELAGTFSPVHLPDSNASFCARNVCVFIMESFSASYSTYIKTAQGSPDTEGYTPFLDSLMSRSLIYRWSFANGRKSVEAIPSTLSSIPSLKEPFVLTPYYNDKLSGIAAELVSNKGYSSAFFHGAPKGSMGFEEISRKIGFQGQFNKETFADDSFFDGTWAIWDEPFLEYYANVMDQMPEPFVTSVFTASSHHPFKVPSKYDGQFKKGDVPILQSIGYSDHALRRFFETAKEMDWFENTLFVIVGDHTSLTKQKDYKTNYGIFEIPIIFYDPSGELFEPGIRDGIAQQSDVMPTVLGLLGYDMPYVAFGSDLSSTPDENTCAINYLNNCYQYFEGDYCLQYDGRKVLGLYNFRTDRFQTRNLKTEMPEVRDRMLRKLQAIIQQYMERMVDDRLTDCYFQ